VSLLRINDLPSQTRIGDIGVGSCPCHPPIPVVGYVTIFVTGKGAKSDGRDECTVGTVGVASCGHATVALTGSSTTLNAGSPNHRVGDVGANCGAYVAVTGSPTNETN
jgi:hypothetical protein